MIAGHLQEKNDFYYVVLNYKDSAGKRHTKWCRTALPAKGNKKRAEAMLMELRLSFDPEAEEAVRRLRKGESPAPDFESAQAEDGKLLFADYLEQWLKIARSTIKTITYSGYAEEVQKRISPWFRERGIALTELQASDIQDSDSFRLEALTAILNNYPDVLTSREVSEVTGYSHSAVLKWCTGDKLRYFNIKGIIRIPKISLVEYLTRNKCRALNEHAYRHILQQAEMLAEAPSLPE